MWVALTAFLSFVPIGLAIDLSSGLQSPFWWVLAQTGFFCTVVAFALTIGMRKPKALRIVLLAYVFLMVMLPRIASSLPSNKALMGPGFEYVRWRLKMDGLLARIIHKFGQEKAIVCS